GRTISAAVLVFFFQAEDGIRDFHVTGVQTCALPIWATNEERQIICYRSVFTLDKGALERDKIQERLSLDCEQLCAMIQATRNRLFKSVVEAEPFAEIQAHPIEKQHDYNVLLLFTEPGHEHTVAQRWRLRLGANGIVQCETK